MHRAWPSMALMTAVLIGAAAFVIACEPDLKPPPTTAAANGTTVKMAIGSYCWSARIWWGSSIRSLCADTGLVTKGELVVASGDQLSVAVPASAGLLRQVSVYHAPATGQTLEAPDGTVLWLEAGAAGPGASLPFETAQREIRVRADLPAGRHVVMVDMSFEADRGVAYGVLLDVR